MSGGGVRPVTWFALAAGAVVLVLAVLALLPAAGVVAIAPPWLVGVLAALAWIGLMLVHEAARRHFDDLRLLRSGLEAVAAGQMPPERLAARAANGNDPVGGLAGLVADIATRRALERSRPDQRLASVIAALRNGVVVVTETGLVSLINAAAKGILGGGRAAVGTSVFAALDRDGFAAAAAQARAAGRKAVDVTLRTVDGAVLPARMADFGEHRGVVVSFAARDGEHASEVEVALDLHDTPPRVPPPVAATLLDQLPVTVLDTETTGLDVGDDRIVSVGAVRMHGGRIYRSAVIDRLVDPGRPIPQRSTAVHGITAAMVAGQPAIAEVLPELLALVEGTVVVGHNIGFDIALLRRAAADSGLAWPEPPRLDTILLAAALEPGERDLDLEALAGRLWVDVSGRHTALGDSLVTAEIFARLLPPLAERGVLTLGQAEAFSREARHVVALQRAAGW